MNVKSVSMWVGVFFLVLGIIGFVPALTPDGLVLGLFLVDPLHNIVHILTGVVAVFAAMSSVNAAKVYFQVFGVVYALVTVLGFMTGTGLFGLLPVNLADNVFHLAVTAVYLYYGFGGSSSSAKA